MSVSIETSPPKSWADFLAHASAVSGVAMTRNFDIVSSPRWAFRSEIIENRFTLQFLCRADPADKSTDFITYSKGRLPVGMQILSWRLQIREAIASGKISDFRAITILTAILSFEPQ